MSLQSAVSGKCCLITGGAGGIGRCVAEAMLKAGAKVTIADLSVDAMRSACDGFRERGHAVDCIRVDLRDESSISDMADSATKSMGKLDILVNSPRPKLRTGTFDETMEEWDTALDTLLKGPVQAVRFSRPYLAQSNGCVVNVSSTNANFVSHQPVAYHAAKAGLEHATRALARELGPDGIRVNGVSPGLVDIDSDGRVLSSTTANRRAIEICVPLGRPARPEDIGQAAVFLASDAASSITGQILMVEGGITVMDHFDITRRGVLTNVD